MRRAGTGCVVGGSGSFLSESNRDIRRWRWALWRHRSGIPGDFPRFLDGLEPLSDMVPSHPSGFARALDALFSSQ